MSDIFNDFTLDVLAKSLDADSLNQSLISNNIANVDTPGYRRVEISFKDQLRELLNDQKNQTTESLDSLKPQIIEDDTTVMRTDGNNVDIDKEMAKLAENSVEYQTLARLTAAKLTLLRIVIEGR